MPKKTLPIVYSCSGCSSAAQMANSIALNLDRQGIGEMSCIAGVGGGVAPLVSLAKSGRPIVALDGCKLQCALQCLKNQNINPDSHYILSEFGVKKMIHLDFDSKEAETLTRLISGEILARFKK